MNIALLPALLLSSKGQAETFIYNAPKGSKLIAIKQYRLLVSHYDTMGLDQQADTLTLRIYRVIYPHLQEGKGWGEPVIAEQPHRTVQQNGVQAMLDYLAKYGFVTDEGWEPVEEKSAEA